MLKLVVFCISLSLAYAATITQCPDNPGYLPVEIRADDCSGTHCIIPVTGNILFEIDAITQNAAETISTYFYIVDPVAGDDALTAIDIPESQFGCGGLTVGSCPLSAGQQFTWRLDWPWQPSLVEVGDQITVRVESFDDQDNTIVCFKLPVEIGP